MSPDTKVKLAELSELSIGQLAAKYEKLFGEKFEKKTIEIQTSSRSPVLRGCRIKTIIKRQYN